MLSSYDIEDAKRELRNHTEEIAKNDFSFLENCSYRFKVVAYLFENRFNLLKYLDTIYNNMFRLVDPDVIKKLTIPNNIKEIQRDGFLGCKATEIIFNNYNIRILPERLFSDNVYLKKIILPQNLKIIPSYCFFNSRELKELMLPDSVQIIGKGAFENCNEELKITANYRTMNKIKAPKSEIEFLKSHLSFIHSENEENEEDLL